MLHKVACKGILAVKTLARESECILAWELLASFGTKACIAAKHSAGKTAVSLILFC